MDEFDTGQGPSHTSKYELRQGIQNWVAKKLHREKVYLSTMERMNWEEILLIAAAMGYRPRSQTERSVLTNTLEAHRIDRPAIEGR